MKNNKLALIIIILMFILTGPTVLAVDQLAIWNFGPDAGYVETVESDDVVGTPTITVSGTGKDGDGGNGVAYTDVETVGHDAGQSVNWDDIYYTSNWVMTINTTNWENISIRWNYKSDNGGASRGPTQFDFWYKVGGGSWVLFADDSLIARDDLWHESRFNMSAVSAIDHESVVYFRANNFDGGSTGKFFFDNLEVTGTARANPLSIAFADPGFTDADNNVSGVISGSTDPAANDGINFKIGHSSVASSSLTVTAASDIPGVVPDDMDNNLIITRDGDDCTLKVIPTGVGYTNIEITVSHGTDVLTKGFYYAASAASSTTTSRYHTGMSDASTAIALDDDYMFVGNDEPISGNQAPIFLYDRDKSGLPINEFDFSTNLSLPDAENEVDIEASVRIGDRIFWLCSHGNNKDGDLRLNRHRLFATDIVGSGSIATLSYVERYDNLRTDLIDWDDDNDPGYGLAASAAYNIPADPTGGIAPKNENGFNIEGFVMSPDGDDAYICFRAPISPVTDRTKALIVPIENFVTWFNGLPESGSPTFGIPIELDLGGRGIRSIDKNDADEYLIVAGSYGTTGTAPDDFRCYLWTGEAINPPVDLSLSLSDMIDEGGSIEGIVEMPTPLLGSDVQFVLDNGTSHWYGDGEDSKDLGNETHQKFRSDVITMPVKNTLYVYPGRTIKNGLTWDTAYDNIQDALDNATTLTEIWVAKGTYKPTSYVQIRADVDILAYSYVFKLTNGIEIYGGFDPAGGDVTWDDRDWKNNETILSGDRSLCYRLIQCNGAPNVVLDGFTVTSVSNIYSWDGGGIAIYDCSPIISNCIFKGMNMRGGDADGAAMHNLNASPTVTDCIFKDNIVGDDGGALCNKRGSNGTFMRCIFSNNVTSGDNIDIGETYGPSDGGAIFNTESELDDPVGSSPTFINCVIVGNTTVRDGGGIANSGSGTNPVFINCTISGNTSTHDDGGGMATKDGSVVTVINSIFWGNTCVSNGAQIFNSTKIPIGTTNVTHSDIQGGYPGANNVNIDPQFEADEYHLSQPGVLGVYDAGVVAAYGPYDIDRESRVMRMAVDMGADEIDSPSGLLQQKGDADGDGKVEFDIDISGSVNTDDYDKWNLFYTTSTYDVCSDFNRDGVVDLTDKAIGVLNNCLLGETCPDCQSW